MKFGIYSIYDKVSCECGPLFNAKNLGVASRYVEEILKNSPVKNDDYCLCYLGDFDSEACCIWPEDVVRYEFSDLPNLVDMENSVMEAER